MTTNKLIDWEDRLEALYALGECNKLWTVNNDYVIPPSHVTGSMNLVEKVNTAQRIVNSLDLLQTNPDNTFSFLTQNGRYFGAGFMSQNRWWRLAHTLQPIKETVLVTWTGNVAGGVCAIGCYFEVPNEDWDSLNENQIKRFLPGVK